MVVICCTQQLMRNGRNVTIFKKFGYSTGNRPLSFKNYVEKNSVPRSDKGHLYECKRFHSPRDTRTKATKLTPQEVDNILRANEYTHKFSNGSVKSYDSNQLAANDPIEDTRAEASCLITSGLLVGVFDGHGGDACAQVLAKRLYHYIAACLLPHDHLRQYVASLSSPSPLKLIESYNDKVQLADDIRHLYNISFRKFLKDLVEIGPKQGFEMRKALEKAFLRLDEDLSREALTDHGGVNVKTLAVAQTGAVVCVAHIDGAHLHLAHVGDSSAVLGTLSDTNSWTVKRLTEEHNCDNKSEVERVRNEHPYNERDKVIANGGRLLGMLAPYRAMGDFILKWSKEMVDASAVTRYGKVLFPQNYHTPPYLSAVPEVTYHRLTPRDKFLVIASDGLWDEMSPLQVVRLVGEHMRGKLTLSPLKVNRTNITLEEINELLLQRKEGLKMKPKDANAATHVIRNALGGTEYGIDHSKLAETLSLSNVWARYNRDDITITVVYFDSEYLRHCPP